jgi:predicted lipoprotein with Yx(FWY)xxD motif
MTAQNTLGTIVADTAGRTVYVFDKDKPGSGTSACAGSCATLWPAVMATATAPTAQGVTGTLGTISTASGAKQLTLNGMPLYYYSKDSAAGEAKGQGFMGIWWVLGADGTKMSAAATTSGY